MINFLNDCICLNCLTQSIENAKEIIYATEGHVLVGILSSNYPTEIEAEEDIMKYKIACDNNISIGLGQGNPKYWRKVSNLSSKIQPKHINQVFSGVGYTRALVKSEEPFINALVSPTNKPGMVKINTGELSSSANKDAIVDVETAVLMAKEMGANSIKFFPMKGLKAREELIELSKACAKNDFYVEPTGGIDLENFYEINDIILSFGVKKVIPHVYTSIIDKKSNLTSIDDVKKVYKMMNEISKKYRK